MREQSETLTEIFAAYQRRDWLDLYKSDESVLHLARGRVVRNSILYDNYIASVEELNSSIDTGVDRITINCQNVNSLLGFNLASNLRLLDYAVASYGKIYQSVRNPNLEQDSEAFRCVLANAEVDETRVGFELIADYDSIGAIIAARNLNPLSAWRASNGIEVTATGSVANPKTGADFIRNGKEWEFGGWEFFEEPTSDLPGAGGNDDIGIGAQPNPNYFLGENPIWTPSGEIPFAEAAQKFERDGRLKHYSFDPKTGDVCEDDVDEFYVHETIGYFDFHFDDGVIINPTEEHPFFVDLNRFVRANDLYRTATVKAATTQKKMFDSKIAKIKWNSDKPVTVYNLKSRRFPTYHVGRRKVHNKAISPYEPDQY